MTKFTLVTVAVPIFLFVVALPLILGLVPRNYFYGFRTPTTLASDEAWYAANRFSGIALALASGVWLLAGRVMAGWTESLQQAQNWTLGVGMLSIGVVVLASFIYLRRLSA
jgi:uncharacterized membrane protein